MYHAWLADPLASAMYRRMQKRSGRQETGSSHPARLCSSIKSFRRPISRGTGARPIRPVAVEMGSCIGCQAQMQGEWFRLQPCDRELEKGCRRAGISEENKGIEKSDRKLPLFSPEKQKSAPSSIGCLGGGPRVDLNANVGAKAEGQTFSPRFPGRMLRSPVFRGLTVSLAPSSLSSL